jgi:hypothetical protein
MEFIAADLDALCAIPSNAALLESSECRGGTSAPDSLPWRVGGFNISTHPDLVEWTAELAEAAGATFRFVCGRPAILAGDRILGWGRGTHDFVIRAAPSTSAEILARRGHTDERYGTAWLVFAAFLPDVPRADHRATIARWLEAARDA